MAGLVCGRWAVVAAAAAGRCVASSGRHAAPGTAVHCSCVTLDPTLPRPACCAPGWPVMLASSERGAFLKKVHSIKVRQGGWLHCCWPHMSGAAVQAHGGS